MSGYGISYENYVDYLSILFIWVMTSGKSLRCKTNLSLFFLCAGRVKKFYDVFMIGGVAFDELPMGCMRYSSSREMRFQCSVLSNFSYYFFSIQADVVFIAESFYSSQPNMYRLWQQSAFLVRPSQQQLLPIRSQSLSQDQLSFIFHEYWRAFLKNVMAFWYWLSYSAILPIQESASVLIPQFLVQLHASRALLKKKKAVRNSAMPQQISPDIMISSIKNRIYLSYAVRFMILQISVIRYGATMEKLGEVKWLHGVYFLFDAYYLFHKYVL